MICYTDTDDATTKKGGFSLGQVDAVKVYLSHYDNYLYLSFIIKATSDWVEKRQALKEIAIAERKLKFWERQSNFNKARAEIGIAELKKKWKTT